MEEEQDLPEQPVSVPFKFKLIVEKLKRFWVVFSYTYRIQIRNKNEEQDP